MLTNAAKHFAALTAVTLVSFFVYMAGDVVFADVNEPIDVQDSLYGAIFQWKVGDLFGGMLLLFALLGASWMFAATLIARDHLSKAPADEVVEVPIASPSYWPLAAALGTGLAIVGLVINTQLAVLGFIVMAMSAIEWITAAWTDRYSTDPATNHALRTKLMLPLEIPFFAVVLLGVPVFLFSRVLLASTKDGATIVAGLVAIVVLAAFFVVYLKPDLGRGLVTGVSVLAAVGLLVAGIAAAAIGQREFEIHVGEHHSEEEATEEADAEAEVTEEGLGADAVVGEAG